MSLGVVPPALAVLERVVIEYLGAPRRSDDPMDIAAGLVCMRTLINRLELTFAHDAARFAAAYDEGLFDNPSPYSWMREHCHMTGGAPSAPCASGTTRAGSNTALPRSTTVESASPISA